MVDGLNRAILAFNTSDGYDAEGHPVHSADVKGVQRKQGYDALNRLVSTIDDYNGTSAGTANAQSVSSYDASDNLEAVSDRSGLNTIYDHNGLGDLTGIHSPDTGTTTFTMDAAGNTLTKTDARGIVTTYAYDALNRPLSASYADTTLNAAYHYDEANTVTGCAASAPIGHLTRVVEQAVTTVYCYDKRGNVIQKKQAQGTATDVLGYSYTAADRVLTETRPGGAVVRYGYDTLGQVSGVWVTPTGGAEQVVASGVTWLPFGPILTYTLGNGQTVSRTYDANYRVTAVVSPALELRFTLDYMGNIKAVTETGGASATYLYDPLYRLTSANDATGKAIETYTYNPTGDRLSKTAPGAYTGAYKYQAGTHWLTATGTASRTYDANGNTTGNAAAGTVWSYGYNGRNRMTVVQQGGSTVGTYVYNANNERVAKTASKVTTRFVYDEASQLVSETSGTARREYVAIGGLPVAVVDGGTATTIGFVTADGLGSPRAVTSAGGAVIWNWPYSLNPFGENRAVSTSGYVLNLRLPGQYADGEAGLKYNLHRSFDAASGRYLESDPLGLAAGPSVYAYVGGRPLVASDPLGLANVLIGPSVSFIAGGGGTAAVGLYFSYTRQQGFDLGVYGSVAGGVGVNIGFGGNVGYVPGEASNISGTTVDLTGGVGPVTGTVSGSLTRPTYASYSAGVGYGLPAAGALTATRTGHYGIRDAIDWFRGTDSAEKCGAISSGVSAPISWSFERDGF